jgi:hypothetical protein
VYDLGGNVPVSWGVDDVEYFTFDGVGGTSSTGFVGCAFAFDELGLST